MIINKYKDSSSSTTYAFSAETSNSTKLLEGNAGFPDNPSDGDVVAIAGSTPTRGAKSATPDAGIYQYTNGQWAREEGIQGQQGPQGQIGPQGPQGADGIDQAPTELLAVSELPESGQTGEVVAVSSSIMQADVDLPQYITDVSNEDAAGLHINFTDDRQISFFYGAKDETLTVQYYKVGSGYIYLIVENSVQIPEIESDYYEFTPGIYCYYDGTDIHFRFSSEIYVSISAESQIQDYAETVIDVSNDADVNLYQYDGSVWNVIGGAAGGDLVHVDTLPASGNSATTYEYKQRLFKWVDGAGKWGRWILTPMPESDFQGSNPNDPVDNWLLYSTIPFTAETKICELNIVYDMHCVSWDGTTIKVYTGTSIGVTPEAEITLGSGATITYSNRSITIDWLCDGYIRFRINSGWAKLQSTYNSMTVSEPHFEAYDVDLFRNKSNYSTGERGFPLWDSDGVVVGRSGEQKIFSIRVNTTGYNSSLQVYYNNATGLQQWQSWYIPMSHGTQGQFLQSMGDAEPVWVDAPGGGGGGDSTVLKSVSAAPASVAIGDVYSYYGPAERPTAPDGEVVYGGAIASFIEAINQNGALWIKKYDNQEHTDLTECGYFTVQNGEFGWYNYQGDEWHTPADAAGETWSRDLYSFIPMMFDGANLFFYVEDSYAQYGFMFDPNINMVFNTSMVTKVYQMRAEGSGITKEEIAKKSDIPSLSGLRTVTPADRASSNGCGLVVYDNSTQYGYTWTGHPVVQSPDNGLGSVLHIERIYQSDYDDLVLNDSVDPDTLYLIVPEPEPEPQIGE